MSNGKALFPVFARGVFSRLSSWAVGKGHHKAYRSKASNGADAKKLGSNLFRAIERIRTESQSSATPQLAFIAIVDVYRFSLLRRQIGHQLANRLMAVLVERLRNLGDEIDLGRVGRTSIEIAFAAPSISLAEDRLKTIIINLEQEVDLDGYRFQLPITIGAAEVGEQPIDEALFDRAAAAVTEAQEAHRKVRVTGHDVESIKLATSQLDLMRDLRWAMANGGLELFYQPKLRTRTNDIDSVEALLRWTHPDHGPIATGQLIDIVETSGAIFELTRWVMARAIHDQEKIIELGFDVSIYLNLSGALVADGEFCKWAIEQLSTARGKFGFEITETAVIEDPEVALENLKLFSESGIRIAIDDYGSGLSSLTYLKQLPANELKIDRSFISGLTTSHRDPLLVRSSIDLAHALEMDVTAEGVSDPVTLSLLRVMGCDLVQGYLISHPLPLSKLQAFLQKHRDTGAGDGYSADIIEWDINAASAAMGS